MTDRQEEPATEAGRLFLAELEANIQDAEAVYLPAVLAIEREATDAAMVAAFDDIQAIDRAEPPPCDDPAGHLAALCDRYLEAEGAWHEFVNLVYRLIPDGDIRGPIIGAAARLSSQPSTEPAQGGER